MLRQAISESNERFVELGVGDGPTVVGVKAVEQPAPGGEETPEAAGYG